MPESTLASPQMVPEPPTVEMSAKARRPAHRSLKTHGTLLRRISLHVQRFPLRVGMFFTVEGISRWTAAAGSRTSRRTVFNDALVEQQGGGQNGRGKARPRGIAPSGESPSAGNRSVGGKPVRGESLRRGKTRPRGIAPTEKDPSSSSTAPPVYTADHGHP